MITTVLSANPGTTGLFLVAGTLALIFAVSHLARRAKTDPACKHRFGRYPAIMMAFISITLTIVSWTAHLEVNDMINYFGQFLGIYLVVLAIQSFWNSLRAPGSAWIRIILSPLPLLIAPLALAATMSSHSKAVTMSGGVLPLWADHTYQYAVVTADYLGWLSLAGVIPATLVIWGIVVGCKKLFGGTPATP